MGNKLHDSFLNELFKLFFHKKMILEMCIIHLRYEYIPIELNEYKKIYRFIKDQYLKTNKLISYGVVNLAFRSDLEVLNVMRQIVECDIVDSELIIDELQNFIRDVEFQLLNEKIVDLYNKGEKEEAIRISAEKSKKILNINLRESNGKFLKLFGDFNQQQNLRKIRSEKQSRIPFGISELDRICFGGLDRTDIALVIMRSGVGKSTWLRYIGFYAAFLGYKVLHIQLEGSQQECFDRYTQIWTSLTYSDIKEGSINESQKKLLNEILSQYLDQKKEIEIYSIEKFEEATMYEIRNVIRQYDEIHCRMPDLVVIDSLDLLQPGDGKNYGVDAHGVKMKMQKVAQLMKNLAIEFDLAIVTSAQASNVPYAVWNNPDQVIDRSYTEGDKTLVKPFSYVFTGNQTMDEKNDEILRIYIDKLRNYKVEQPIVYIKTKFDKGKFFDGNGTVRLKEQMLMNQVKKSK